MSKCKKSEVQAIDYAAELLDPAEAHRFEEHLKACPDCTETVQSLTDLLALTDRAHMEELNVPETALENIEMAVYKRLAAVPPPSLLSRFRDSLAPLGTLFRWQRTLAAGSLVTALITIALFVANPFRTDPGLQLTEMESADTRMEQYRQQHIQRDLEEALITQHLRNDTWETESRLYRVKEQADGTNWTQVAEKHLRNLRAATQNGKSIN